MSSEGKEPIVASACKPENRQLLVVALERRPSGLQEAVSALSFTDSWVNSAKLALAEVATGKHSVVLICGDAPLEDALELCRQLKVEASGKHLPVLLVRDESLPQNISGFGEAVDEYVRNPVERHELEVRIDSLIMRYQQQAKSRAMHAELVAVQEKKSELAAMVVHDLRNPLSAIIGNVQLMQEFCSPSDDMMVQCLDDLDQLGARVLSMANSLMDVEQLEEGLLVAERDDVELGEFVRRFPRMYEAAVLARKLTLKVEVPSNLHAVFDMQLISRIVENLLDNAVRYTPRKGNVLLRVYADNRDLVIEVGNSGPEIPDEEKHAMFERYYRLEARRAGARASRGLGLYFCRLAAIAHDGDIDVQSRPDFPACFILRLPSCIP